MTKSNSIIAQTAKTLAERTMGLAGKAKSGPVKAMADQANRVVQAITSLDEMTRTRNPSETMDTHTLRVADAARRLQTSVQNARGHFNTALNNGLRELYSELDEKSGLGTFRDHQRGAEIRSYMRGLDGQQRIDLLTKAIDANDRETLAAVFLAPDYLTGIDANSKVKFQTFFHEKVAPELMREIELLQEVDAHAQQIVQVAGAAINQAIDPSTVQRILDEQAKAEDIAKAFNQTVLDA